MLRTISAVILFTSLSIHAQLVPKDAVPEKVADGYQFTEGPALAPDGSIYFTDIPAELILRFDPTTGKTTTYTENSGQANGLMFNRDKHLIACRHGGRSVSRVFISATNKLFIPVAQVHYQGEKLNSPNDLAIDRFGNIYFTDPRYGNRDSMEMEIEGVYFQDSKFEEADVYDVNGKRDEKLPVLKQLKRIDADLERPNGIVLSPDQSMLYVADNKANWIYAYDIESPGEVTNKRKFAQLNNGRGSGSDGMCVDGQGRLYATGAGKVWVFEPSGHLVATIDVGKQTTNCTFGADGKTLYVTANKGLYRIKLNTDTLLEHTPYKLKMGIGILEINPALPVQFSAEGKAIEIKKDNKRWLYQKGQAKVNQAAQGDQASTVSEIAFAKSNLIVRLRLDDAELAAWSEKLDDKNKSGLIGVISGFGTFTCIGYATHQDADGSTIDIRPDQPITFASLPKLEENNTIYLYFEVPRDIVVRGIATGTQKFGLNIALPAKP